VNILVKLKETIISVFPVMAIVLLLGLTIVPLDKLLLGRFLVGGIFLILGLTIFLLGVDLGIQPMGERCGAELTKKRNLPLLLVCSFLIGFIVTAAEPDIQVFSEQVRDTFPAVNKNIFTFVIATGVAFFIMAGLFRIVINFSVKITFLIAYVILFLLVLFTPDNFIGIAFDSGGATTGPMTVPFILALGLGVSAVRSKNEGSFGLTGVASVGPIMAVLIYSIILNQKGILAAADLSDSLIEAEALLDGALVEKGIKGFFYPFASIITSVLHEVLLSILPLFMLFILFQFWLLKMTLRQLVRITIGFLYAFVGLTIFLIGVNGGFMQAGAELGQKLGDFAIERGGIWYVILIGTGLLLGAIIVCAEPAVWVLSEQVEQVSGGTIKRKILLIFLSAGTSIAIGLSLWRSVAGFNIKWILIPGYIIALLLMIFSPSMFSGIAFDSGGVASGPLTSTFVLSFTLGVGSGSGASSSFGVIALVAMMPLIAIQIMGIIFKFKTRKKV